MITSIDKEGTGKGADLDLVKNLQELDFSLPIIYSGGVGSLKDIKLLDELKIDAIALSRVIHYDILEINKIKQDIK